VTAVLGDFQRMADSDLVRTIRDAYAAYNGGDIDAVIALLDEDVEFRPPPTSPEPEPLYGREGAREYLSPNLFDVQRAEPLEFVEEGDRVLVAAEVHIRGSGSGVEIEDMVFHLWHLDPARARARRLEVFLERDQALAALRA
jgi:ketosteroid isomerase-like protein